MLRRIATLALAICWCLSMTSISDAQRRGNAGGGGQRSRSPAARPPSRGAGQGGAGAARSGAGASQRTRSPQAGATTPPGGQWSNRTHSGKLGGADGANASQASTADKAAAGKATENRRTPTPSGTEDAAAGAAAANRNQPAASGEEGAAAGAAVANRNQPEATGAEGAAAGAAAVNRNQPEATGAQGAVAGAAAANRNQPAYSGAEGAAAGYAAVRNSFTNTNVYGAQWYGGHPGAWVAAGWAAGAAWAPTTWETVATQCGYATEGATSYNYGDNVTAQDGNVMVDGQNVGTVEEYSLEAATLADTGAAATTTDDEDWLPLGVFAMVRNEQQHPQLLVQLAINKQGVLRGNYTDEVTDHTLPIRGAVDKDTQRAAWRVGDNQTAVMEAGLVDLTGEEAPALLHKNGKTDHWLLIRLEQPQPAADATAK